MYLIYFIDKEGFSVNLVDNGHVLMYSDLNATIEKINEIKLSINSKLSSKKKVKTKVLGLFVGEKEVDNILTLGVRFKYEQILKTIDYVRVNYGINAVDDLNGHDL